MVKRPVYAFCNGLTGAGVSGGDQICSEYLRVWSSAGHPVTVFAPELGRRLFDRSGCRFVPTDGGRTASGPAALLAAYARRAARTLALARKLPLDGAILFSSSDNPANNIPGYALRKRAGGAAWVTAVYLIAPPLLRGYAGAVTGGTRLPRLNAVGFALLQRPVLRAMRRRADLVLVLNRIDRDALIRRRFAPARVLVAYPGVDFSLIDAGVPPGSRYDAVFVGRIHPQKGIPVLLACWRSVCDARPGARLAMIGAFEPLRAEIRNRGLSANVELLGVLTGRDKMAAVRSAKMFLLPSSYESFAVVAAEAMACGLPVIACDLPVFREVYPRGMVRVPVGDAAAMAAAALGLLADERARRTLADEAAAHAAGFRWESSAQRILDAVEAPRG